MLEFIETVKETTLTKFSYPLHFYGFIIKTDKNLWNLEKR